MTETNPITLPAHYQFKGDITEVRDIIRDRTIAYLNNGFPAEGLYDYLNAIKYLLRAPAKNGLEDFKKGEYCIDSLNSILNSDAELTRYQPVERGSGDHAADLEVGDGGYEHLGLDLMDDIFTRLKEAMSYQKEEMQYNVEKVGEWYNKPSGEPLRYPSERRDPRIRGYRSPKFCDQVGEPNLAPGRFSE